MNISETQPPWRPWEEMSTTMSFEQDITEDVETNTSEDGGHDIIEVESTYTYNVATSNRFANLE